MADETQIRELKEKMALERANLLSALKRLSDDQASTPLKPDEWSAKQQMSHLCEMAAAAGLRRLFNLEGGTEAWIKAGYPVEK